MGTLSVISGVILTVFGITLFFTPITSFIGANLIFAILLLIYGVIKIFSSYKKKRYEFDFIFALVSVAIGIFMIFSQYIQSLNTDILVYIMATWFIIQGGISIYGGISRRNIDTKTWFWEALIGAISIILGIVSYFNTSFIVISFGVLVGIYFVISGVSLIVTSTKNKKEKAQ